MTAMERRTNRSILPQRSLFPRMVETGRLSFIVDSEIFERLALFNFTIKGQFGCNKIVSFSVKSLRFLEPWTRFYAWDGRVLIEQGNCKFISRTVGGRIA